MPIIGVNRNLLFKALGREYTEDEFQQLCFEYGLELDEVTSEKQMICKEIGSEKNIEASDEIIYRVDIPANRYDLLCLEGLVRALLIFQNKIQIPLYQKSNPSAVTQLNVTKETLGIRPFAVAAILRNVTINQETYDSFIDLQDKLHQNICRKRSLASIGTHDLDTVQGPFTYTALPPKDIKFVPLNQTKEFVANDLLEFYSTDSHLKPFVPIIKDLPRYPVVLDKNGTVLSLPPIINSDHSKITLNTKNIFIEVTATDLNKATIVLDTIVTMFSEYCENKFEVEPVQVNNSHQSTSIVYPSLEYRRETVNCDTINQTLGISKSPEAIAQLLQKMGVSSSATPNTNQLEVIIPPTRHDILHECDIAEDVGISFGYNNIEQVVPKVVTIGKQQHINKLTDQLRGELSRCTYTEILTFSLCSREDIGSKVLQSFEQQNAIEISNPKTFEFQVARTSLIPGMLKTICSNKKMPLPLKLFEISDVVYQDSTNEVGARNERRLCAAYYNKSPGFEQLHGLLDRVMQVLEIPRLSDNQTSGYFLRSLEDPTFLNKRCASVIVNGQSVGRIGVLQPEVILNFELVQPCSVLELSLEKLLTEMKVDK